MAVSSSSTPLVSMVLTTRDRPQFLQVALACFRHQTYPRRELIVIDDGDRFPADMNMIEELGGRLIRMPAGTPLGTKLNRGIEGAHGWLCQKMDDDDWYGCRFLETMVSAFMQSRVKVCRPVIAFLPSFLFFELARWEIRRSISNNVPGATLLFTREDWQQRPFRALYQDEDVWFLLDQIREGLSAVPVPALEHFLAVRHRGAAGDRGHTWTTQADGRTLENYLEERPLYHRRPEDLLPKWALDFYRQLHKESSAPTESCQVAGSIERRRISDNAPAKSIGRRNAISDASRFTSLALLALDEPLSKAEEALTAASDSLMTPDLPPERCDLALLVLASVIFTRPNLLDHTSVSNLLTVFRKPELPANTFRLAGEVMNFLLTTPVAVRVAKATLDVLSQPDLSPEVYKALIGTLRHAVTWAKDLLNLDTLLSLAELEHLTTHRDYLLQEIVEPCLYAAGESATAGALARLVRLYGEANSSKYCFYNVSARTDFDPDVRESARKLLQGRFSLHEVIAKRLGSGRQRILIVQNINDGQGDEIVHTVPVIQALLDFNPVLEIVLLTRRVYLYAHPRLTLIPFKDRDRIDDLLRQRFDAVIDFFEQTVLEVNHDPDLEEVIQNYVRQHGPFLFVSSTKGHNHFVYEQIHVESRPVAQSLGLDRHRVENIYETTFRLIAELGLPLRCGEDPPMTDWVLAGLPWSEAEGAWRELIRHNTEGRPIALLNPFGGAEPLKGCVEQHIDKLSAMIRQLIREHFYVVLLPNGTPWGTASLAADAISCLESHEQRQVVLGPDPDGGSEADAYPVPGAPPLTHPDRVLRMVIYFIRFADLIVTVEGWMTHASYCLGKKYRLLMMPYSYPDRWHPYATSRHQQIALGLLQCALHSSDEERGAPPIIEQPRKFVMLFLLREFGNTGDAKALELLRRAARSEDRDLRQCAALSLGKLGTAEVELDLISLLQDSFRGVRADAASALLELQERRGPRPGDLPREYLIALVASGNELRNWAAVIRIGEAARPALELALQDDDPVVRREALQVKRILDFKVNLHQRRRPSVSTRLMPGRILRGLFGRVKGKRKMSIYELLANFIAPGKNATKNTERVLILTPVKNASHFIKGYSRRLAALTYPHHLISVGLLESDSNDSTYQVLQAQLPALRREFKRVGMWKRDFGYHTPSGVHRGTEAIQVERRTVLAKSRNHLLMHALDDEDWVLWLDVDVIEYPTDIIERLLATGKDIVHPHCVLEYGGQTFDKNAWRNKGRVHMEDLRQEGEMVELDAVGGTMLLVRADLHRDGLIFPAFPYGQESARRRPERGELETEGLGLMAQDMGHQCWGMPHLEIRHARW